jgi:hypothetical protein
MPTSDFIGIDTNNIDTLVTHIGFQSELTGTRN